MRATERLLPLAFAAAAVLSACAGGAPPPGAGAESATQATAGDAIPFEELLARLDILIAAGDEDGSLPAAVVAEARALRVEALAALATGADALARDFLAAAIALFGDGPG